MLGRATESRHPASVGLQSAAAAEVLARLLAAQQAALDVVQPAFAALAAAADLGAAALSSGHRMAYAGAGSSGLMALADGLELAGTFGIPSDRTPVLFAGGADALLQLNGAVEDNPALAAADLARVGLGPGDVVICVSASGATPYTVAVARGALASGAQVIALANVPGSELLALAGVPVLLATGPEVISGSTRLAAATAQKAALNLISVLIGIRLGHVHDGYMVNLTADNAKLKARAVRIVAAVSGRDPAAAQAALRQSAGAVKPAILIARGLAPERAATLLAASGGHLAAALAALDR